MTPIHQEGHSRDGAPQPRRQLRLPCRTQCAMLQFHWASSRRAQFVRRACMSVREIRSSSAGIGILHPGTRGGRSRECRQHLGTAECKSPPKGILNQTRIRSRKFNLHHNFKEHTQHFTHTYRQAHIQTNTCISACARPRRAPHGGTVCTVWTGQDPSPHVKTCQCRRRKSGTTRL